MMSQEKYRAINLSESACYHMLKGGKFPWNLKIYGLEST